MSKFTLITVCVLAVLGATSVASATTTYHLWEFNTDDPMPDADDSQLGPGIAPAKLRVTPGPLGWQDGVWSLSGEIDVIVYNDPAPRERKEIKILLTWRPGEDLDPFLVEAPSVGVAVGPDYQTTGTGFDEEISGTPWLLSTYDFTLWPNPPLEGITIKGDILVDRLEIWTECIPEPATMALLGFGSLALLRRRRA